MSQSANPLPKPRRIMTANLPLPSALKDSKAEPAADIVCEELTGIANFDGARYLVFNHKSVPTVNHSQLKDLVPEEVPLPGVVMPNGVNVQIFDIGPHAKVPMHRTTSTDYIVFQIGTVVLTTYSEPHDTENNARALKETVCRAGDILIQRGTLHGWENQTDEWARVLTFILASEPTSTGIEGSEARYELADVVF